MTHPVELDRALSDGDRDVVLTGGQTPGRWSPRCGLPSCAWAEVDGATATGCGRRGVEAGLDDALPLPEVMTSPMVSAVEVTVNDAPGLRLRRSVPPEASLADDLFPRARVVDGSRPISWTRRSVNGAPSIQSPALPPDGVARSRSWYVPGFMFLLAPVRPVAVANGLYLPHLPLVC